MEESSFGSLKTGLLKKLQNINSPGLIDDCFRRSFFRLVERCTFSLMNEEESFFALFMIQVKRSIKLDMPSPTGITASLSGFIMYFNPLLFLECTLPEMKALIKHEIYHIIHSHPGRAVKLREKYCAAAVNTAMDISINQYIKNLPLSAVTLQGAALSYNADLKAGLAMEEYAKQIQKAIDRLHDGRNTSTPKAGRSPLERAFDIERVHDIWLLSSDSISKAQFGSLVRRAAAGAAGAAIPAGIGPVLEEISEEPEIQWPEYLKKIAGTLASGYKKTVTRKDRRQPDRLDLRGKLPDHKIQIAAAIDISGSMTDIEIKKAMTEIMSIVGEASGGITIIECDSEIRRVYKAMDKSNVREKLITGGGTRFSPVFRYLREKGMRDCLLVYFTDGLGEKELDTVPPNSRTLWVLTGKSNKLSLERPWGQVKRLQPIAADGPDMDYFNKEIREMLVEWQK
jgi:predicted metal-dependent peptidase